MKRYWVLLIVFGLLLNGLFVFIPDTVKADPVPEPYIYWEAPANSFGATDWKFVNWSYFKQLFNAHTDWMLEYKRYSTSEWTNGDQYLDIDKSWNESGYWKINLTFTAPVSVFQARFTFGCDLSVLDYVERAGQYAYYLNYTVPGTDEVYSVFFNWSDLVGIPGLTFTHGINNGLFWMRFSKYNIPVGSWTFDPTFGVTSTWDSGTASVEITIRGQNATTTSAGAALYMMARLYATTAGTWSVKCGIYDNAWNLLGITETKTQTYANAYTWYRFNFSTPVVLSATTQYHLGVRSDSQANSLYVDGAVGGGQRFYKVADWPNPLTTPVYYSGYNCVYCVYTCTPTVSVVGPTNASTGITLLNRTSVAVTDPDGDTMTVCFWNNKTGSWVKAQQNSSTNGTVRDMVSAWANTASTKYWWKITVADAGHNVSAIYHFTTASNWTNHAPVITLVGPTNGSTGIDRYNRTSVYIGDADGNATTVTFQSNATGSWVTYQVNSSVTANTTVRDMNSSWASAYSTKYWWRVYANDGHVNVSKWFYFTTEAEPWSNNCPVVGVPSIVNQSVDVLVDVGFFNITVTDGDGNTTNGIIACSNGEDYPWVDQANGTQSLTLSTLDYSTNYTVWVNVSDDFCSKAYWFWFITEDASVPPWSNTAPTITTPSPVNKSTNIALYSVLSVYIGDADGNDTVVVFWAWDGVSWESKQVNSTVTANTTVRLMNATWVDTNYTVYQWMVTAEDEFDNSSATFWFKTQMSTGLPFYLQMGFDALNVFLFIWFMLAIAILFGKNVYQWFIASLCLILLSVAGGGLLDPDVYGIFMVAMMFIAGIGFVKTLNHVMSNKEG